MIKNNKLEVGLNSLKNKVEEIKKQRIEDDDVEIKSNKIVYKKQEGKMEKQKFNKCCRKEFEILNLKYGVREIAGKRRKEIKSPISMFWCKTCSKRINISEMEI